MYLKKHVWEPHAEAIEHVCRHHTGFDPQCEGSRAEYVYEIVGMTGAPERFAEVVARRLENAEVDWDGLHVYSLARMFVRDGNVRVKEAMAKRERDDEAAPRKSLSLEWKEMYEFDMPCKVAEAGPPQEPEYRRWSYVDVRSRVESGKAQRWPLVSWGKRASEADLHEAAEDLLKERDSTRLRARLWIFEQRKFPLDPEKLTQMALGDDEELATSSCRALQNVAGEDVREVALSLIAAQRGLGDAIALLARNYVPGDERRIEKILKTQTNDDSFHWCGHSALKVFEGNMQADALPSMTQMYERGRCSICRLGVVTVLLGRGVLPEWMAEECRYDSYTDIRATVKGLD